MAPDDGQHGGQGVQFQGQEKSTYPDLLVLKQGPQGIAMGEVTFLLAEVKRGNSDAFAKLMPLVYREMRRLAGHYMRDERAGHTLQPTALVHEAYLRLVGQDRADWQNRAQFMGVAAQIMRRILVDHARGRAAAKRAGVPVTLDDARLNQGPNLGQGEEILAVDEVLARLSELDGQQARVVELRYFGGLSVEETAEVMGNGFSFG